MTAPHPISYRRPSPGRPRSTAASLLPTAPLVLVVDDQAAERDLLALSLSEFGLRTLRAEDADSALATLDRHGDAVGLALIDVMLPGIPGTELADLIHQRYPGMRVVLMSGYDHLRPAKARLCGTGDAYLAKPASRAALRRAVASALPGTLVPE